MAKYRKRVIVVAMAMNDEFSSDAATRAGIGGSIYSYLKRGFRMEGRNPNSAPQTIGTIGTPSSVYHSVGPLYEGIETTITEGRSVRGC